ncbi:phytoene desaturase family protein [Streptomyces sp. NPDC050560]|uniref:phytoene desaturase family protein n=1 Tax=Streptomyces sp. NPDC050560 TaxID=3365630 RepID=UPI00379CD401
MREIAVVGAGMGAMAAAARLAVAGRRVVVFERSETYGGSLGVVERDGFRFDTGPGVLPLPAVYRDLFVKTGRAALEERVVLEQREPAVRHVFADGAVVDLPNASRAGVGAALDGALGRDAGARWAQFMDRAREAWNRSRRPLLEETLWPNWQVLAEREPYPARAPRRLLRRGTPPTTLAGVAQAELGGDARLRALLEHYALVHGLDPRSAPAAAAVLPYLEQTFGVWSVAGGLRALATALYERCRERRVVFRFGSEVTGVREKDGAAAGVVTADGAVHEADAVVAGVFPAALDALSPAPVRGPGEVGGMASAPSRLTVLLALRGAAAAGAPVRTVVHTPDRGGELEAVFGAEARGVPAAPTVVVRRTSDPLLVPDGGHEAVTVTATVPAGAEVTAADVERLVERAGAAVEGLRERLLWHEARTPADIAAATGAPGGAVPPPALPAAGGRLLHPANSTRLPGLYAVGGWSHPGGGLPHAGMSGALAAGLIVEGPGFQGSR